MSLFFLFALLLLPQPSSDELKADFKALEAAKSEVILEPTLLCIKTKFDAYVVPTAEKGDESAALHFASTQLKLCDLESSKQKLLTALSKADPSADQATVDRRANYGLSTILLVTMMRALRDFEVKETDAPSPPPIGIPCPPELKGVRGHPCYEDRKN